jgi:flagellar biosynthetic protein FliQ
MNQDTVTQLAIHAMTVTVEVSAPFQAATSIQEVTLSFIPKILVTGAVVVVAGPWMLGQLVAYTQNLFLSIPSLVGP